MDFFLRTKGQAHVVFCQLALTVSLFSVLSQTLLLDHQFSTLTLRL